MGFGNEKIEDGYPAKSYFATGFLDILNVCT